MSKKRTTPSRRIHAVSPEQQRRNRMIRIGLATLAGVVVLILAIGIFQTLVLAPNSPIAVVHGTKITTKAYQARLRYQSLNLAGQMESMRNELLRLDPDDESTPLLQQIYQQQLDSLQTAAATLPTQVLETMIEEELVRQEAARRGLTVTEPELEEQVGEWFGYDPNPDPTPTAPPTATAAPETPTATTTMTAEASAPATATSTALSPTPSATVAATATAAMTASPTTSATGQATVAATSTTAIAGTATATRQAATVAATATSTAVSPTPSATIPATSATGVAAATETTVVTPEASPTLAGTPEPTATPLPTPTPMTLESYQTLRRDYLEYIQKQTGFGEADFLAMMRTYALQEKLQEALAAEVPTSAPQVNVRQILVYSQEEIDAINERLEAGEEFGALAQELSQDTAGKENGGELGWMPLTTTVLPQTVVERAFEMEPGQREVVSSYLGLHLIEVVEKADDRPLDEATVEAAKRSALQTWLDAAAQADGIERRWSAAQVPEGLPTGF